MEEEEIIELLEFLATDYGRGYLAGLVNGISIILKILKIEFLSLCISKKRGPNDPLQDMTLFDLLQFALYLLLLNEISLLFFV